jgi:hypothetical protein
MSGAEPDPWAQVLGPLCLTIGSLRPPIAIRNAPVRVMPADTDATNLIMAAQGGGASIT